MANGAKADRYSSYDEQLTEDIPFTLADVFTLGYEEDEPYAALPVSNRNYGPGTGYEGPVTQKDATLDVLSNLVMQESGFTEGVYSNTVLDEEKLKIEEMLLDKLGSLYGLDISTLMGIMPTPGSIMGYYQGGDEQSESSDSTFVSYHGGDYNPQLPGVESKPYNEEEFLKTIIHESVLHGLLKQIHPSEAGEEHDKSQGRYATAVDELYNIIGSEDKEYLLKAAGHYSVENVLFGEQEKAFKNFERKVNDKFGNFIPVKVKEELERRREELRKLKEKNNAN